MLNYLLGENTASEGHNESTEEKPNRTSVIREAEDWIDLSFLWVDKRFLWKHKNVILFPLDVCFDVGQCTKHFYNGHVSWGLLTMLFIALPNIIRAADVVWNRGKPGIRTAIKYLFLMHLITIVR